MTQYEVINFYYGEWSGSCGKFDNLHDAIERKLVCDTDKEEACEAFTKRCDRLAVVS